MSQRTPSAVCIVLLKSSVNAGGIWVLRIGIYECGYYVYAWRIEVRSAVPRDFFGRKSARVIWSRTRDTSLNGSSDCSKCGVYEYIFDWDRPCHIFRVCGRKTRVVFEGM